MMVELHLTMRPWTPSGIQNLISVGTLFVFYVVVCLSLFACLECGYVCIVFHASRSFVTLLSGDL
jgi:hypothetical protein